MGMIKFPEGGLLGTTHHNVDATAAGKTPYRVGDKLAYYDETAYGVCICAYYLHSEGSNAVSAAGRCLQPVASGIGNKGTLMFKLTQDASAAFLAGPLGISLSAMTDTYYGWCWIGGVPPLDYVPTLGTTDLIDTDTNVAASGHFDTVADGVTDDIELGLFNEGTDNFPPKGLALAADGADSAIEGDEIILYDWFPGAVSQVF